MQRTLEPTPSQRKRKRKRKQIHSDDTPEQPAEEKKKKKKSREGRKRSTEHRKKKDKRRRVKERECVSVLQRIVEDREKEIKNLRVVLEHYTSTATENLHVEILGSKGKRWQGQFVTMAKAATLDVQTPVDVGSYYYFQLDEQGRPQLAVAVIRSSNPASTAAACALAKLMVYHPKLRRGKKKKMLGSMHAHGFRFAYCPGGGADRYQPTDETKEDMASYRQFINSLDTFVNSLQSAMDRYCPVEALQAAHVQLEHGTPTVTKLCFMGNLTVTFNFASSIHFDKDASWAIGQWFGYNVPDGTNLGAFVFPGLGLSVPFTDGVIIVWHSALVAHGTAKVPNPKEGLIIGTSIQITQRLVTHVEAGGFTDWLKAEEEC